MTDSRTRTLHETMKVMHLTTRAGARKIELAVTDLMGRLREAADEADVMATALDGWLDAGLGKDDRVGGRDESWVAGSNLALMLTEILELIAAPPAPLPKAGKHE